MTTVTYCDYCTLKNLKNFSWYDMNALVLMEVFPAHHLGCVYTPVSLWNKPVNLKLLVGFCTINSMKPYLLCGPHDAPSIVVQFLESVGWSVWFLLETGSSEGQVGFQAKITYKDGTHFLGSVLVCPVRVCFGSSSGN